MRTIYKYELAITDVQKIIMPENAQLLHVGEQDGKLMLWAQLDSDEWQMRRTIRIFGTGNPMDYKPEPDAYIGTAQVGSFVWHVFDGGLGA